MLPLQRLIDLCCRSRIFRPASSPFLEPPMSRNYVWSGVCIIVLLSVIAFPNRGAAQTGEQAGKQDKKGDKTPTKVAAILNEHVNIKEIQNNDISLKEALLWLHEQLEARGIEFNVIVDTDAFKEENPDAPDIYDTKVRFPAIPKKM